MLQQPYFQQKGKIKLYLMETSGKYLSNTSSLTATASNSIKCQHSVNELHERNRNKPRERKLLNN